MFEILDQGYTMAIKKGHLKMKILIICLTLLCGLSSPSAGADFQSLMFERLIFRRKPVYIIFYNSILRLQYWLVL